MKVKHLVIRADSGHCLAFSWDCQSWASITQTRRAICRAASTPGMGLSLTESIEAQWHVQQTAEVRPSGIYGFFMGFFGTPQSHDAAILELTQEAQR
jgi:hypothetical protein